MHSAYTKVANNAYLYYQLSTFKDKYQPQKSLQMNFLIVLEVLAYPTKGGSLMRLPQFVHVTFCALRCPL
jgi:hypothetical protein